MALSLLSEREHNMPMAQVATVTAMAARLREKCNSSWIKAVDTSWSEMSEVRAAMDSRA